MINSKQKQCKPRKYERGMWKRLVDKILEFNKETVNKISDIGAKSIRIKIKWTNPMCKEKCVIPIHIYYTVAAQKEMQHSNAT